MRHQYNEINRKAQVVRLAIGLLIMTAGILQGQRGTLYLTIYVLGMATVIKRILHKKESISIDSDQICYKKQGKISQAVDLASINKINIMREGNWAIRKDTLMIQTVEETIQWSVSDFNTHELMRVLEEVCDSRNVEFDAIGLEYN